MKTPRDILLERHRAAMPELDAIRHGIVDAKFRRRNFTVVIWQELIQPSRRVWSGLAAAWVLILTVNLVERDPAPAGKIVAAPAMMSLSDQQRLLNELFADRTPAADADREKTFSPKPRTEKFQTTTV
jgi:hypothetical protein